MRSSSLARVVIATLGVSLVITLGCSEPPTAPSRTPTPTPTPTPGPTQPWSASQLAALALFEAARVHAAVTTSPLTSPLVNWALFEVGKVWSNGPCLGGGSVQGSLDGGLSPPPGTLPTGSHTYVVSFSNCLTHPLGGGQLNGVASAAYDAAEWTNLTAMVSAESVRGQWLNSLSDELEDVTAEGSAVWTSVGSTTRTMTYTPATGSRLVNNSTTNVATFGGGSYSEIRSTNRKEQRFDNLEVAINGTEYTLNGSLVTMVGGSPTLHTGEVRIVNNGTLVARIYGDVQNALKVEVMVPLVPL